jgi:large subunit ribosomal protein L15
MQLHNIQPKNVRASEKRIGRGGKRGKTSGKGGKGQTARAGNSTRPEMRDIIKKLPKLRGHGKNRARTVNAERVLPSLVNLKALETAFPNGGALSPATLLKAGLITIRKGKVGAVKILGTGEVTKKFTITGCEYSAAVKTKIEAAGGTIA